MAVNASQVGKGATATNTVTTAGGAVTTGDTLVLTVCYDPGVTISAVTDLDASNTFVLKSNNTSGFGKLAMYVCENATGHASLRVKVDFSGTAFASANLVKVTGAAAASYDSGSLAAGTDTTTPYDITSGTLAQAASVLIACAEINRSGGTLSYASSNFTILGQENDANNFWSHGTGKLVVAATTAVTASFTKESPNGPTNGLVIAAFKEAAAGGSVTTKVGTDTIDVPDTNFLWKTRRRQGDESTLIIDATVSGNRRGRVTTEGIDLNDASVFGARRGRVTSDTMVMIDQVLDWIVRRRTGEDTITPTDDQLHWIRFRRTGADNVVVVDEIVGVASGGGIIVVAVGTDLILVLDESQFWSRRRRQGDESTLIIDSTMNAALRGRMASDTLSTSDQNLSSATRGRVTIDSIVTADQNLNWLRRVRLLDDGTVLVDDSISMRRYRRILSEDIAAFDSIISTFFSGTPVLAGDVRPRIGVSWPPILACQQSIRLGASMPPWLSSQSTIELRTSGPILGGF